MRSTIRGRRRALRTLPVVVALALGLTLVACSDDDSGSSSASSDTSASSETSGTSTTGGDADACVKNVDDVIAAELPDSATTDELPEDLAERIDAAATSSFEAMEGATPGAIVGVRSPEGTFIKAYGLQDRDTEVAMTSDLHQRIGSITKTFTGTVILQLAEDGELSLDDPVEDYVRGVPNGDRITLRHLMNMTSGLASYTFSQEFGERLFGDPIGTIPVDQLLEYGYANSPIFEPGAMYNYSNTNFVLLGKIIEEVTGQPAFDVIRERVIEPLELTETSWPGDRTTFPWPYPQGYTEQGEDATPELPSNATHWNPSWAFTAGGLVSDMDDLLTYGRALGTGQGLLDADAQTERLTSFPNPLGQYSYGLAIACQDGWVGHTGELMGYNTSLYYDTSRDTILIIQTNSDISTGACTESPTLALDPKTIECHGPATRIAIGVSEALGHPIAFPAEE
jgi:D-alanyl-D-alanine carboxypeptidase